MARVGGFAIVGLRALGLLAEPERKLQVSVVMSIYAGTSGFSYREWKGTFYPDDLPNSGMLAYYAGNLPAVEINNTFYRLPKRDVIASWAAEVPEGFRFVLKASRRITHFKRLGDAKDVTEYMLAGASALGERLGAILFQLPPNFRKDLGRLREFLTLLPGDVRSAFEFRNESWRDPTVYDLLSQKNAAWCVADTEDEPEHVVATADWGYLRLRRPGYSETELSDWVDRIKDQNWTDAYVFFKHEDAGAGPKMASRFLKMFGP